MNLANQKEGRNLRMHLEKLSNFRPPNKYLLSAYCVHKIEDDGMEHRLIRAYYHYECTALERVI